MEQFPKVAKARMAAARPGPHPDAEQLSAFSENALGAGERETVLAHLATCVDCRDIVGLAAAVRPTDAPVTKPVRAGFRWATFQWAAVAASLAIVTVAVLLVGPHQPKHEQQATETAQLKQPAASPAPATTPSEHAAEEPATPAAKSAPKRSARDEVRLQREPDSKLDRDLKTKAGAEPAYKADGVTVTNGGFGGIGVYSRAQGSKSPGGAANVIANDEKKMQVAGAASATASAPAQYSAVAPNQRQTDSLAGVRTAPAGNQPAPATAPANIAQAAPAAAADKEETRGDLQKNSGSDISKDQQANSAALSASTESMEVAKPRFSQKAAKGAPGKTGGIVATRFDSGTVMWRIFLGHVQSSADNGVTWQERSSESGLKAVAAAGKEVFVGGTMRRVFMSHDNGQTWTPVKLTPGTDLVLEDSVSEIRITSVQTIDVILTNGEDFQTTDGGKSFHLLSPKIVIP